MNPMTRLPILAAAAATLLAGCASAPRPAAQTPAPVPVVAVASTGTAQGAIANLASASGSLVSGRLVLSPDVGGVRVRGEIGGLVRNGTHNLRLHTRGDCSAVDAISAGPEFDAQQGIPSTQPDSGERGRIVANGNGVATLDLLLPGAVLGGGAANDIVGRGLLILGATPGAISARVACGTVQVP
ncbi:superoxide dismutase family protein [Luteimonas sp. 3794]|uniref:superoxide dismutase family protein n=1 Tax=Luteimonas sp. 3794 TaxID=2817730 RepID=UPI0028591A8F|nr:superoxide dismutase family protein [Luteimonas sp. 3794]MDR6990343.1 Cu-Zn family superoxide dismutase [Luteimonas sp. 3794]